MKELISIQSELKAPKNQFNSFGNYSYRSAEDILEAVKPLLAKNECTLVLSDDIFVAGERVYVKATATIKNNKGESEFATSFARESLNKKGMDDSQVTGATSSYARKYALNGLFCIDDTKDADYLNTSDDYMATAKTAVKPKVTTAKPTPPPQPKAQAATPPQPTPQVVTSAQKPIFTDHDTIVRAIDEAKNETTLVNICNRVKEDRPDLLEQVKVLCRNRLNNIRIEAAKR